MIVRMCVCMYVCSSWNEIKFLLYQINTRNPLVTGFSLLITALISHIIFMFQFNWCNRKLKWKLKSWNKISILVGWGGWFSILLTIVWFLGQSKNLSQNPIIPHLVMPLCVHLHTPRAAVAPPSRGGLPLNSFHQLGYRMPLMPFFFSLLTHTYIPVLFHLWYMSFSTGKGYLTIHNFEE